MPNQDAKCVNIPIDGQAAEGLEVALFADAGSLALAIAQVVELRSADVAALDNFDLPNGRSVHREGALDSYAVAQLADRVGLLQTAALTADDVTLEDLDAFFTALDHAHVDFQFVARLEVGDVATKRIVVDDVGGLHSVYLRC